MLEDVPAVVFISVAQGMVLYGVTGAARWELVVSSKLLKAMDVSANTSVAGEL